MTLLEERAAAPPGWQYDDDGMLAPVVPEGMTHDECCLAAILRDPSGLDFLEFAVVDDTQEDRCWRAYPYQWAWWRSADDREIDQTSRSAGKSQRMLARACVFRFNWPGQESVLVTPEQKHADAITDRIEPVFENTRLLRELLKPGRLAFGHRPFRVNFLDGTRWYSRLPGRFGTGVKGCLGPGALVLCRRGLVPIEQVVAGDEVWSHEQRWSPVLYVESFEDDVYQLDGAGAPPVVANALHRVYCCEDDTPDAKVATLGRPFWEDVDSFVDDDGVIRGCWLIGTRFAADCPLPAPPTGGEDAWWLAGRLLGCGKTVDNIARFSTVRFGGSGEVLAEVTRRAEAAGLARRGGTGTVTIRSKPFAAWVAQITGLPTGVLSAGDDARQAVLEGFLSGDGRFRRDWTVIGLDKPTAIWVGMLARTCGYDVGYTATEGGYTVRIDGLGTTWPVDEHLSAGRVRSVAPADARVVHNIVPEDHSYLADGVFHHNCHPVVLECDEGQDISPRTWNELPEVIRWEVPGAKWLIHGVSKGVRDQFYHFTEAGSGFKVHRYMAMDRPTRLPRHELREALTEARQVWQFLSLLTGTDVPFPGLTDHDIRELELAKYRATKAQKIKEYGGSEHSPDFQRNYYGVHGEAMDRIFQLARLMRATAEEGHPLTTDEYYLQIITGDEVAARAAAKMGVRSTNLAVNTPEQVAALLGMLNPPGSHTERYKTIWIGQDVGLVSDPSEILVAAEYLPDAVERRSDKANEMAVPPPGVTRLKLIARIQLRNIPNPLQVEVIMWLIDHYKPKAYSLDATGLGRPLFQDLQARAGVIRTIEHAANPYLPPEGANAEELEAYANAAAQAKRALTVIKGYNFSEKIPVGFDEEKVAKLGKNPSIEEMVEKAGVKVNAKDAATDVLRDLVDNERWLQPYDEDIINDLNAQTWTWSAEPVDAYGRRRRLYSGGAAHILDGARMLALGWAQAKIEELIHTPKRKRPTPTYFVQG